MAMITPEVKPSSDKKGKSRQIDLSKLLENLQEEYRAVERDVAGGITTQAEMGFYTWFVTSNLIGLHWIGGDPYRATFPPSFQGSRLERLCSWLRTLETEDVLRLARESRLKALQAMWPTFLETCTYCRWEDEYRKSYWRWDAISSIWNPTEEDLESFSTLELPHFMDSGCGRLSQTWHLDCMAVLFLNRALKLRLSDLSAYRWDGTLKTLKEVNA